MVSVMDLELPENFPFDKPPKAGVPEQFLVDATPKKDGGRTFTINSVDGVPMNSPGKASAPMDEANPDETPEGEADADDGDGESEDAESQATGAADEQPEPSGGGEQSMPPVSVGQAFSKKIMGK